MTPESARAWLADCAVPLWFGRGRDLERGGFHEALTLDRGEPVPGPKRTMVQGRQIYAFQVAAQLGAASETEARAATEHGLAFLLGPASLPSGAFAHAVDLNQRPVAQDPDLYAQAFALFGLARAYGLLRRPEILARARALLAYLHSERRLNEGGYSELHQGQVLHEANAHMHLFEAALAWMEVDPAREWRELADEILALCRGKFIDADTGLLAERFDAEWSPLRTGGRFTFEPGHQYEWAWLMGRYAKLTGKDLLTLRRSLVERAERYGVDPSRKSVIDEVWSDQRARARSSRFWPQCERIKANLQLAAESSSSENATALSAAEEAMRVLFRFFETSTAGLWYDVWPENGVFAADRARASALYHIVGALEAYLKRS